MLDLGFPIPKGIKSRWVKSLSVRLRVFNTQIFDGIYAHYNKDNAEMNRIYLEKNFHHLMNKAINDENISEEQFDDFCEQYEANLDKLVDKEKNDKKAFPEKTSE